MVAVVPESVALNSSGSVLWAPFKRLHHIIENAVIHKDVDAIPELESALKSHRTDFLCLLKNPPRNSMHREVLTKAPVQGIAIAGQPGMKTLPQQLVDEALIISDMFELNELSAVELLLAGQHQQPHFPGLTRGLVAVLLYYDGRRCLVNSLKLLVQAREGRTWTNGLSPDATSFITSFTEQLKEDGMMMRVFDLIETIDIGKELDSLHKNRALGSPRYRKQVSDLLNEIKQSLAEIVFNWSCQGYFTRDETMRLLGYLAKQTFTQLPVEDSTVILATAFLYVIDVSFAEENSMMDATFQKSNLIRVPELCAAIHKELFIAEETWKKLLFKSVFQFAWGLSIRMLLQCPTFNTDFGEVIEDDERFTETAIENGAFVGLRLFFVNNTCFREEEYYLKRVHKLITDFIVYMPIKVKDMRNCGDESARIIAANAREGLEPPAHLPMHFQHFLLLIADLYADNPLGLDLSAEYWWCVDYSEHYSHRVAQRQVTLNKFVRSSGDLLPAALFVPYHLMLKSLASTKSGAHHCFNMLKSNGKSSVGSSANLASWDHFFTTLHNYHLSLREGLSMAPDSSYNYRHKMLTRGITPEEVQGLIAVLDLIAQVVRLDDIARITLAENPEYSPCAVILGLVTCSVSHTLKAALIHCLAAFSMSPELAHHIWSALEETQVIPTVPTTSQYFPTGVQTEIEEVETRHEEYPVTLAVLELLNSLLDHPNHAYVGAGRRFLGLQPYLDFVREKIFLKCNTRAYKNEAEKWKIIIGCLEIMRKVLGSYHVKSDSVKMSSSHHRPNVSSTDISTTKSSSENHPGFSIMTELLRDSGSLRMVLYVLSEGMKMLDAYCVQPDGQTEIENATKSALVLIYEAVRRQGDFLQLVRDGDCGLLVTSLDNLLMNINVHGSHYENLLVISKYVSYCTFVPIHSLLALRILHLLCSSGQIAKHLAEIYEVDSGESEVIMHGFVECLEAGCPDPDSSGTEEFEPLEKISAPALYCRVQEQCLQLLMSCLRFSAPNLSYFLLGFDRRKPIQQTEIQEPGVMGSPRTCLHAVVALLDAGIKTGQDSSSSVSPSALSLAYQLVYTLCANKDTSGPVLRYLRSTHDFFYRHLQALPFPNGEGTGKVKVLSQTSWLLKAIAIELRVTSAHHQRSHVQRLISSFLDDGPTSSNGASSFSAFTIVKPNSEHMKRKLMLIFNSLDFSSTTVPNLQCECFDAASLQKIFKECEKRDPDSGVLCIDVGTLSHMMRESIPAAKHGGIDYNEREYRLQQELTMVLQYANLYNEACQSIVVKKHAFGAWCQLVEILLLACPLEMLSHDKKHQVMLEICRELIHKVREETFLSDLMPSVSSVILSLTVTLRRSVAPLRPVVEMPFLLPNTPEGSMPFGASYKAQQQTLSVFHHSALTAVLKAVLDCLIHTESGLQRIRANYYTALLNLLCIAQRRCDRTWNVEAAVLDQETEFRKLRKEYMDTIMSYGDTIVEIVCRDACTAHDITKMLSLSVLDIIFTLDGQQRWLNYFASKGYLCHVLDSLSKDYITLQELFAGDMAPYRVFYLFESKMALLTRLCKTEAGAIMMLRNGAVSKVAECNIFDLRPDGHFPTQRDKTRETGNWMLPDIVTCYQQLLRAVMSFLLSLMTSLGLQNVEVTLQLLGVICENTDFFLNVIRSRSVMSEASGLKELFLVIAFLSRVLLVGNDLLDDPEIVTDMRLVENKGKFHLLQQHLLSLLPCLMEMGEMTHSEWANVKVPSAADADPNAVSELKLLKLKVASHILGLCCRAISSAAPSSLQPNLVSGQFPDISLIVNILSQLCAQLQNCVRSHKLLLGKLQSVVTLTTDELNEFLPNDVRVELTTAQERREIARESLSSLLQERMKEFGVLVYMIECSAFILLCHLEYNSVATREAAVSTSPPPRRITATGYSVRGLRQLPDRIHLTHSQLALMLSSVFFQEIQSVVQHVSRSKCQTSFLEAVIHRMKRIVKFGER